MSTPASRWIDARISDALDRAFERIDGYQRDGYCTEEDVYAALMNGWGEGVAEGWREWIDEGES
ncbi:hypothetical protein [Nocardioides sp. BYT-33-1]|uniref:hypothetical protein n=1 Tax=Nocardioides sp. BYT-33-1 TaxID=3416952 RepID=UPI003F529678